MLEKHHVFGGAYRSKSEKLGMTVHLCHNCHNEPPKGVHHNAEMNRQLKARAQRKAMEYYGWSVEDFINMFGKNYLEYGRKSPLRELWDERPISYSSQIMYKFGDIMNATPKEEAMK